jgi:hypothetical protein
MIFRKYCKSDYKEKIKYFVYRKKYKFTASPQVITKMGRLHSKHFLKIKEIKILISKFLLTAIITIQWRIQEFQIKGGGGTYEISQTCSHFGC